MDTLKYLNFLIISLACSIDFVSIGALVTLTDNIQQKFDIGHTLTTWALTAYAITFASFIAYFGRLGDIVGNGPLFTFSALIFSLCSLMCATIPNFEAFVIFRALQGIGAAGILSSGYALIPQLFTGPKVTRYFSIVATITSVFFGVGLFLGGAFAETELGYKGLFYFFFGFILLLAIISYFTLLPVAVVRKNDTTRAEKWQKIKQLDYIGICIFVIGSTLLVVGLTQGGLNWNQPTAYVFLPVGLALIILFLLWNMLYGKVVALAHNYASRRVYTYFKDIQVLIPGDLVKFQNFVATMLAVFILHASITGFFYVIEQYGELVDGLSALKSGVRLLPFAGSLIVVDMLVVIKHDMFKPKTALLIGTGVALAGAILFVQLKYVHIHVYSKILLPAQILIGGGSDLCFCYLLSLAVGYVPENVRGIASGVFQTFAQFGIEVTLSIVASMLGDVTKHGAHPERGRNKDKLLKIGYYLLSIMILDVLLVLFFVRETTATVDEEKIGTVESKELYAGD